MPTVNIYGQKIGFNNDFLQSLKEFIANLLSGTDIALNPNEVSIRIINSQGSHMIAPIECEIKAHSFPERVSQQDEICKKVREYILQHNPGLPDMKVRLILAELGHSF